MSRIGLVAIGRNEGERLRACLRSARAETSAVVYVDSGSTDGSAALAQQFGAEVVMLDLEMPFTAARARNAGVARLRARWPEVEFVQFVDGDCELAATWFTPAVDRLAARPELAVVAGRRRERDLQRSVYNRLCDWEWNTPVGEAKACGGDALMRLKAFDEVGGFNPTLIAGEEPELCVRLRARGWRIERLDAEMTWHDAAMTRFGQWWRRSVRAGHAYAEGAALHGKPPERHWVRESRSIWLWGLVVPLLALGLAAVSGGWSLLLVSGYALLAWRVWRHCRARRMPRRDALVYTFFTLLGKFPQMLGQLQYHLGRFTGRRKTLIEYKEAPA